MGDWDLIFSLVIHLRCMRYESESEVTQLCPTLCDHVDCTPPGSSVHGILQARILEWVVISFSRGSSWPRDRTRVSRIAGRHFNLWATREDIWSIDIIIYYGGENKRDFSLKFFFVSYPQSNLGSLYSDFHTIITMALCFQRQR